IRTERSRRVSMGHVWLLEAEGEVPARLYQVVPSPDAPLSMRVTPVAAATVSGPPTERSGAPVITAAQFRRLLERHRLPAVDADEYFRRQEAVLQPGQSPAPLDVDVPPPAPPPSFMLGPQGLLGQQPLAPFPGLLGGASPLSPALIGGTMGFGPMALSPTPTAGDSLNAFLRLAWANRSTEPYSLYNARQVTPTAPLTDPAAYEARTQALSPSGRPPIAQIGRDFYAANAIPAGETAGYWHYHGAQAGVRYRVYVTTNPEHAPDVMGVLVREFIQSGTPGVDTGKVAAARNIGPRRDNIVVTAADLPTLERIVLRLRELGRQNPAWLMADPLPMTDPLLPGVGVAVEPPGGGSFGSARTDVVAEALAVSQGDFEVFRAEVRRRLLAAGVNPDAPHAARDLVTLSPERRAWLQAGESALGGYHAGGIRSPAATGAGMGMGMGFVTAGGSILWNPEAHPHAMRDLAMSTGFGGLGGYGGGQLQFALDARWAPTELTRFNATWGQGMRGMVLPRIGAGAIASGVTAPLMTLGALGIRDLAGDDITGTDYAALGARSTTSGLIAGGAGTGAASLTVFMLGGAAAGSEVPIIGNLVGAGIGLLVYYVADETVGARVEGGVREALGEGGCVGRTPPP
ncbi:MAG TPA: T3SS effector HopA1 family protein, partial [Longimicrobiaceae bacterium]|nr:T3SS effector HopA1 family protein [Longimicrobiaceae bacterium]